MAPETTVLPLDDTPVCGVKLTNKVASAKMYDTGTNPYSQGKISIWQNEHL